MNIPYEEHDVIVIGGGAAGIAAAVAAAKNGADTLLVESGTVLGGDLLAGLPIDGCLSSCGEWIVRGISDELFQICDRLGGYMGAFSDRRALWMVGVDPDIMSLAVVDLLSQYGVKLLLYTFAETASAENGTVEFIEAVNKAGRLRLRAKVFIDCTGDGDIAVKAGASYELGGAGGELQPVSMVFRMSGINIEKLLAFVVEHPENVGLAESPMIGKTKEECAKELYDLRLPKVFFVGDGPLLKEGIAANEIYPCSMLAIIPVSAKRNEVAINSSRISGVNAIFPEQLSNTLPELVRQVEICSAFLTKRVPGFEKASFSGMAPRIGVRETRRITGDYVLQKDDIMEAKKYPDGIAKGGHELDIHGAGKNHERGQIRLGGSYDIPYGCLTPVGISNLLIAGRCISSTREAHSSARVMGTCMATGQAAGTAAALCVEKGIREVRKVGMESLRATLKAQGAVLETKF